METLARKFKFKVKVTENATANKEKMFKKIAEDLQMISQEINDFLDQMEAENIKDAKARKHKVKSTQENVNAESLLIEEEMPRTLYRLKEYSNEDKQQYKLFHEMTQIVPQVARQLENEKQLVEDKGDITFVPSKEIVHQVKNDKYIGTISTHRRLSPDSTIYAKYERTLQMQPSFDKEQCHILGMILISNEQMIVADYNNNKIKMIDICNGRLISQISLSSEPRDVIKLSLNQVAVALPDEQHIQIMSYTYTSMS
jgi:hypothetical protein